MNQKLALEGKRNKLEDALVDGTIDREAFKRKHTELQNQILHTEQQLQDVDDRCRIDVNLINETLAFTRDIYATYKDAPPFMKRHYLRFFYEKVMVKNKEIFETIPTPIFATLRDNQQVILKTSMFPSPILNRSERLSQVIKAFQNPIWAEQAKERLKQIKTLTLCANVA